MDNNKIPGHKPRYIPPDPLEKMITEVISIEVYAIIAEGMASYGSQYLDVLNSGLWLTDIKHVKKGGGLYLGVELSYLDTLEALVKNVKEKNNIA